MNKTMTTSPTVNPPTSLILKWASALLPTTSNATSIAYEIRRSAKALLIAAETQT
ncbi:MAG: hypothetical protein QXP31_02770 [Pyrobaculum sp.]